MAGSGCSFVLFGALAGGFVSGLAGFDTGLVALGIWLHVIEPRVAASLVVVCSVVSQAQTIPTIWHAIRPARLWPFIEGLIGVAIGTMLLARVDPGPARDRHTPRRVFGRDARWPTALATGARRAGAHAAIGFAGGIMGGLAGLSGTLPTMWATPRAWGKDERRGVFQAFNLTILSATLIAHTVAGMLSAEFERLVLLALPGTVTRACLGSQTPQRPPIRPRRADPARRVGGDLNLDDPGIAVFRPKRSSCPTFFSPSRPAPRFAARRSSLSAFRIEARRPERPSWAQSGMGDLGRVWTALRWQVAFWSSAFRWLVRPCVRPLMRPSHAPLAIMPFARVRSRP
jgi:uncharacterized protein